MVKEACDVLKLLGAGLVFVSFTGLGFRIARDFRERPRQLRALMQSLRLLQAEIEYSVTPLPLALEQVARRSQAPMVDVFQTASDLLKTSDSSVLAAFEEGLAASKAKSAFRAEDYEALEEFGKTLGMSDRVNQSRQLQVTLTRLDGLEREAREIQKRNERLWQYLGVLTGLLVVILLY
ncbi:MAG: stage III sporulation protein AB [Alicyclobacillus sp. RIFOXYA1_FULL_53_8]|nr:MAG: stage III sporulation protein AB [Alicyclobacillus sp. RIFOXYA1_FULL_53_8]